MFLWTLLSSAIAQDKEVDLKLLELRKHNQQDSIRTELLTDLAYMFKGRNNILAIKYFEAARKLGMTENTQGFVGGRNLDIGEAYLELGNAKKAMEYYLEAEQIYKPLGNKKMLVKCYVNMVNLYLTLGEVVKAKAVLNKAYVYIDTHKASKELCYVYSSMGDILQHEGLYDSAIIYLRKIINVANQLPDEEMRFLKTFSQNNLGLMYKKTKRYEEALGLFYSVLKDSSIVQDDYLKGQVYNNIASTYSAMGNFSKAKIMYDSSLLMTIPNHLDFLTAENYKNLAEYYENQRNVVMENVYLKKYYKLNDSLNNSDNRNRLNELEQNYQEEEHAKLLTAQMEASKRYTLVALFTGIIALGLFYFYFRLRRKSGLLLAQKAEIEKQNRALDTLNKTKDKLFKVIGHDLRNPLVSLSSYLNNLEKEERSTTVDLKLKKETTKALQDSIGLLDNLLTWASTQLKDTQVAKRGIDLSDLLEDVCIDLKQQADLKTISIQCDIEENARYIVSNPEMLSIVFRNILTNAIKFSYPESMIKIVSSLQEDTLRIDINDHGLGMTKEQLQQVFQEGVKTTAGTSGERGSGLGMSIIKDFLDKLDIGYHVESEVDKGTSFSLFFKIG